jgi:hypothetical protein
MGVDLYEDRGCRLSADSRIVQFGRGCYGAVAEQRVRDS